MDYVNVLKKKKYLKLNRYNLKEVNVNLKLDICIIQRKIWIQDYITRVYVDFAFKRISDL